MMKVLVAGIGGASLGTEIMKCLRLSGRYEILGCDISRYAYGHYSDLASHTEVLSLENYRQDVLSLATHRKVDGIIAGAGTPLRLLNEMQPDLAEAGIALIGNNTRTISLADDKRAIAAAFDQAGILQPGWLAPQHAQDDRLNSLTPPLIVKPSSGSGASRFVFLVEDAAAASIYIDYLIRTGLEPIVQEYVSDDEGEFSIGALNRSDGSWVGAIIMRRIFINELSIRSKTKLGTISSPYGQGEFGNFPIIVEAARRIASTLHSTGPLNIQGRLKHGQFFPFEVNARFSGSCFVRALAGFNEVDLVTGELLLGERIQMPRVQFGWALRGLSEVFVEKESIK
jgi:carbamoyl-phosphate synthase large subunit